MYQLNTITLKKGNDIMETNNMLTTTTDYTSYIKYLQNKSKSELTIKAYVSHIEEFFRAYSKLTKENIVSFKKSLQKKAQKPTSINTKLSSLKSYNEYLKRIGVINDILIDTDDFIAIQTQLISPNKYDLKDIEKMFNKVKATESKRNISIIYLLLSTGIRRKECVDVKLSDINFETGELFVRHGKGDKQRKIALHYKIIEVLQDYINTERKESRYSDSEFLFISRKSDRMDKATINKIMTPYKINPHALRHFFASNALDNGMTIIELRDLLGHKNSSTTDIYTHPTMKQMKQKMNKMVIGF
jgi:integrase/recombinase XerD